MTLAEKLVMLLEVTCHMVSKQAAILQRIPLSGPWALLYQLTLKPAPETTFQTSPVPLMTKSLLRKILSGICYTAWSPADRSPGY